MPRTPAALAPRSWFRAAAASSRWQAARRLALLLRSKARPPAAQTLPPPPTVGTGAPGRTSPRSAAAAGALVLLGEDSVFEEHQPQHVPRQVHLLGPKDRLQPGLLVLRRRGVRAPEEPARAGRRGASAPARAVAAAPPLRAVVGEVVWRFRGGECALVDRDELVEAELVLAELPEGLHVVPGGVERRR